jgi:hypothetical protein
MKARDLKIRAEVINGEVYVHRDDLIRQLEWTVPYTLSVMAVRFVSAFTHALRTALPDMNGQKKE